MLNKFHNIKKLNNNCSTRKFTYREQSKKIRGNQKNIRNIRCKDFILEMNNIEDIVYRDFYPDDEWYGIDLYTLKTSEIEKYYIIPEFTFANVKPNNDCLNCLAYSPYPPYHQLYGCINCRSDAAKIFPNFYDHKKYYFWSL
jgi:hypothetical protein